MIEGIRFPRLPSVGLLTDLVTSIATPSTAERAIAGECLAALPLSDFDLLELESRIAAVMGVPPNASGESAGSLTIFQLVSRLLINA